MVLELQDGRNDSVKLPELRGSASSNCEAPAASHGSCTAVAGQQRGSEERREASSHLRREGKTAIIGVMTRGGDDEFEESQGYWEQVRQAVCELVKQLNGASRERLAYRTVLGSQRRGAPTRS